MQMWHYMIHAVKFGEATDTKLMPAFDQLGEDGWELVGVASNPQTGEILHYLRKPRSEQPKNAAPASASRDFEPESRW